jgi:ethanolaminephosphotransferase
MTLILSFISLSLVAVKIVVTMPSLEFLLVYIPAFFDKINSAQLAYSVIVATTLLALVMSRYSRDYGRHLVASGQVAMLVLHCLFLLVHKPHNLLLFSFFSVIARFSIDVLASQDMSDNSLWSTVLTFIWLGKSSWFSLANSNSLATIDISGAYTGLASYNEAVVAVLTFVIGYSGPIYFFVACVVCLIQRQRTICVLEKHPERTFLRRVVWDLLRVPTIELLLRSLSLLVFNIIITAMRYHLFIWTVFSPKYFYEIFHTLFVAFNFVVIAGLAFRLKSGSKQKKVKTQ